MYQSKVDKDFHCVDHVFDDGYSFREICRIAVAVVGCRCSEKKIGQNRRWDLTARHPLEHKNMVKKGNTATENIPPQPFNPLIVYPASSDAATTPWDTLRMMTKIVLRHLHNFTTLVTTNSGGKAIGTNCLQETLEHSLRIVVCGRSQEN